VLGCIAVALISPSLQPSFVTGGSGKSRAVNIGRADSVGRVDGANRDIPKWQRGLDTALYSHEASPIERINGVNAYWADAGYAGIAQKMITAISNLRDKGPEAAQENLDLVLPKGLHLRNDVDALLAVMTAAPQKLISELERLQSELQRQGVKPPREIVEFTELISERVLPVGVEQAWLGASYGFRQLPLAKNQNVDYVVIYNHKDFEVRVYQPFDVAKAPIEGKQDTVTDTFASSVKREKTSVGEAFTSIVEYVEKQRGAVKVLMPIMTDYNSNEKTPTGMSLPLQVRDDTDIISDSRVKYGKAQMQVVAVRKFLGVASDREVRDQYDILKNALSADGVYDAVKDGSYSLMQYNPPLTVPWRRSNEIGIHVQAPKQK